MQLADLALGVGHNLHPSKARRRIEAGDVLLVAADPVERFRHHPLETAGPQVCLHLLVTRPGSTRPAQRVIGIDLNHLPAMPVRQGPADPNLIVDRLLGLHVTAEAGVDHAAHIELLAWEC